MTTYLILGASGFLGSQVHEAINRSTTPPAIVAVSRNPPRIPLPNNSSWVPMDLTRASVEELVVLIQASRPDALINCAGRTSGTSEQLWEINTTFVDNLIQALRVAGPTPLVHLGSAAEYGVQPEGVPISESAKPEPVSNYGRSKLAATRKVLAATNDGDIAATVLRVFNPIGLRAPADSLARRAIDQLILAQKHHRHSISLGSLSSSRDFVAASDVATVVLQTTRLVEHDPVINVGSGHALSCRTLVEMLADVAGFSGEILETGDGSERSTDVPWQQADVSLLARNYNWVPNTPISQAVEELWNSMVA
jgi:nucleoside-diphosphate-sugar epimerase